MSTLRYRQLRAEFARLLLSRHNSPEENYLLGEMDDEWYSMTDAEREEIKGEVLRQHTEPK